MACSEDIAVWRLRSTASYFDASFPSSSPHPVGFPPSHNTTITTIVRVLTVEFLHTMPGLCRQMPCYPTSAALSHVYFMVKVTKMGDLNTNKEGKTLTSYGKGKLWETFIPGSLNGSRDITSTFSPSRLHYTASTGPSEPANLYQRLHLPNPQKHRNDTSTQRDVQCIHGRKRRYNRRECERPIDTYWPVYRRFSDDRS
jgi:hypothetical protein